MSYERPVGTTIEEEITVTAFLTAARAEALFTSPIATGSRPSFDELDDAIRIAVRDHHGVRGCAADLAGEYGDHPETAVPRMRWALRLVEEMYEARPHRRGSHWVLVA